MGSLLNKTLPVKKIALVLAVCIVVLTGADLVVKEVVNRTLKGGRPVEVIKNFWYMGYVENDDIGFSALHNVTKGLSVRGKYILMLCLQGAAIAAAVVFIFNLKLLKYILPLAFIISGGLGNFIDRLFRGFVVDYVMWYFDFIPLRLFNPFPVFNLADCYAVCGTIMLLIVMVFFSKEHS